MSRQGSLTRKGAVRGNRRDHHGADHYDSDREREAISPYGSGGSHSINSDPGSPGHSPGYHSGASGIGRGHRTGSGDGRLKGYGSRGKTDKLEQLHRQVEEVTDIMKDNVDKVVDRGEKIERLQDRSEDLEANSIQFKSNAKQLQKTMCWKNYRLCIIITIVVITVLAVITVVVLVSQKVI